MIPTPTTITIPLQTDQHGIIRVGGTRVTLDSLLNYYLQGETAEDLHEGFPTVALTDIYAVIAYYLANRDEVDAYLQRNQAAAEQRRRDYEANNPKSAEFNARMRTVLDARPDRNSESA